MEPALYAARRIMESGNVKKHLKILNVWDIVLILSVLVISVTMLYSQNIKNNPDMIKVTVSGNSFGKYSLNQNREIEINKGTILEIRDGKFRMKKSSCKNQICVKMGWCTNQPVICVPQEIVIEPVSQKSRELITY